MQCSSEIMTRLWVYSWFSVPFCIVTFRWEYPRNTGLTLGFGAAACIHIFYKEIKISYMHKFRCLKTITCLNWILILELIHAHANWVQIKNPFTHSYTFPSNLPLRRRTQHASQRNWLNWGPMPFLQFHT